ncbi:MAG: bifunctional methylenetetrahydrofolate dehydrogenase/methenyltetrahydrofolate cyclohydrolase FolD [Anaerolineales bacterium]|jgi:methylenetetrahydrofolate dehydrogenase (NADP+) / methenyltetrahydrofolate cyclohydrolase
MTAEIIDGKAIAEKIRGEVAAQVSRRMQEGEPPPGLATVLVGDNPASLSYVRGKQKACREVGIDSQGFHLAEDTRQEVLEKLLFDLNADPKVNGILVQLPLPSGLDEEKALTAISIEKDIDGFHPVNVGRLAMKRRDPMFVPCTPSGVMVLLQKAGVKFSGARAVVIGRSNLVGMPTALLLVRENATVTICHSRTENLPEIVRQADLLVAAIGRPKFVRGDWIKPGAIVIDVGINRVEDSGAKNGYRLVGDVDFEEARQVAGAITPVPGGVGPMTIAMLLKNTLKAAEMASIKK